MSNKKPNFADLINAVKDAFSRFIDFAGVSTRPQYWYFILATAIASVVAGVALGKNGQNTVSLITILPTIAASIRRMHDVGRSGWFILIPIYNILLLASPTATETTDRKKPSLAGAGCFVAVSPIIVAFWYSLLMGGSMFNESESTGGGAIMWGLFLTLPIGLLLIVIGVIVDSTKRSKP